MKNVQKIIMIACTAILFVSCNSKDYSKTYKFEDLQITRNTECVFEFNNTSESQEYDVILQYRYAQGYQFNQAVFDFTFQGETGNKLQSVVGIPVRDKAGKFIGEGSGDIWDIEQVLVERRRLPLGKNTFTLKHAMPKDTVHFVMEIGLKIVKAN